MAIAIGKPSRNGRWSVARCCYVRLAEGKFCVMTGSPSILSQSFKALWTASFTLHYKDYKASLLSTMHWPLPWSIHTVNPWFPSFTTRVVIGAEVIASIEAVPAPFILRGSVFLARVPLGVARCGALRQLFTETTGTTCSWEGWLVGWLTSWGAMWWFKNCSFSQWLWDGWRVLVDWQANTSETLKFQVGSELLGPGFTFHYR